MKKYILMGGVLLFAFAISANFTFAAKPEGCATIQGGTIMDSAGQPVSLGYDQWGYNYQANMFNGLYENNTRPAELATSGDRLMMKWNNAWLSNKDCDGNGKLDRHYGFPSYIGSGAWLTNHASGIYQNSVASSWDVSGNWLLDFAGGTDNRAFRDLVQDSEGNVTGEFWWLNGSNWEKGGTLVGNVAGNILTLHYDRAPAYSYTGDFVGTIGEDSITGGTFSDSNGGSYSWTATGTAVGTYNTCSWSDFVKIVAVPSDATKTDGVWYSADGTEIGPDVWGEFAIIQEVSDDPCGEGVGLMDYKSELRSGLGNW